MIVLCKLISIIFCPIGSLWLRGHRHLAKNLSLRFWVQYLAAHASNFSYPDCKKINKALSVRAIVICIGHTLLRRWSRTNNMPESILHKIIMTIIIFYLNIPHFYRALSMAPIDIFAYKNFLKGILVIEKKNRKFNIIAVLIEW